MSSALNTIVIDIMSNLNKTMYPRHMPTAENVNLFSFKNHFELEYE